MALHWSQPPHSGQSELPIGGLHPGPSNRGMARRSPDQRADARRRFHASPRARNLSNGGRRLPPARGPLVPPLKPHRPRSPDLVDEGAEVAQRSRSPPSREGHRSCGRSSIPNGIPAAAATHPPRRTTTAARSLPPRRHALDDTPPTETQLRNQTPRRRRPPRHHQRAHGPQIHCGHPRLPSHGRKRL